MAEIPKSDGNAPARLDVWVCPRCKRASSHSAGQTGGWCGCVGWGLDGTRRVRGTYVLIEATDEMVEHVAVLIAERFGGWDEEHGWDDDLTHRRELDWARALAAEVVGFSTTGACPACRGVGDQRVVAGADTDEPCHLCGGSE